MISSFESDDKQRVADNNHGEILGDDSVDINYQKALSKKEATLQGNKGFQNDALNEEESPTKTGDRTTLSLASRRRGAGGFLHITVEALNTGD